MTSSGSPSFPQFPYPVLTPIAERPTAYDIMVMRKELYANAQSVDSFRGGGEFGHLGAIMPEHDYLARAGVPFIPPPHPGDIPAGAAANRVWKEVLNQWEHYRALIATLRAQILAALNVRYIVALQDDNGLFGGVTIPAFLAYLTTTYGQLTPYELEANREKLAAQWDPSNPIEGLWTHIAKIRLIDPTIDDSVVMLKTQDALAKSGVFTHYLQTWRDKPVVDHTWVNFQDHFSRADLDRKHALTTQAAGYHSAHMAHMAAGAATQPGTAATNPTAAAAGGKKMAQPSTVGKVKSGDVEILYCWTHGIQASHTGTTCAAPQPGHKPAATFMDRQGGSEMVRMGRSGKRRTQVANQAATPAPAPATTNAGE